MSAAVVDIAAAARQGHQERAAEEHFEPVVVLAHPEPVADSVPDTPVLPCYRGCG